MADPSRLPQLAKRAGCAAKQPPGFLLYLLGSVPPITDPNVLVGSSTADDAAVYKLSDDLALVFTTDFFTPIVDRPYDFGAVAAANALSDVYAMAGTPLSALSIVGFPSGALPPEVLVELLRGALGDDDPEPRRRRHPRVRRGARPDRHLRLRPSRAPPQRHRGRRRRGDG